MHSSLDPHPRAAVVGRQPAGPRRFRARLLRTLGLLGLGAACAAPGQSLPPHWVHYAQQAGTQFQAGLGHASDPTALRLQAWARERVAWQPVPPLLMRVWLSRGGRVERLEFGSLGHAQADADLRAVLMAQALPAPPPDLRQPLVLELTLDRPPQPAAAG